MPNIITKKEEAFLAKINAPFAHKKKQRFNLLIAKRDTTTISSTEYEELLVLTDAYEKYELCCLKSIAKLADLKKLACQK